MHRPLERIEAVGQWKGRKSGRFIIKTCQVLPCKNTSRSAKSTCSGSRWSLGGLYLILMGLFYVVQSPITQPVDRVEYLPGDLDAKIKQIAARRSRRRLAKKSP